jgi:hypothetical protein
MGASSESRRQEPTTQISGARQMNFAAVAVEQGPTSRAQATALNALKASG